MYWIAPFRALEDAGIAPQLVHAQHVKQIKGHKTDIQDAVWLARECQFGLPRSSHLPPRKFSELRQQCRYRRKVVADRVEDILPKRTSHMTDKLEPIARTLEARPSNNALWRLGSLLQDFDSANECFQELDAMVAEGLQAWERELDLLQTIPSIARSRAHAILVELGPEPTKVFPDPASLAVWACVCPGNNESAGKRRSGRVRAGNAALRASLTECVLGADPQDSELHRYHDDMTVRWATSAQRWRRPISCCARSTRFCGMITPTAPPRSITRAGW